MKLNLKEVTFSYRGSYMAISYLEDGSRHKQAEKGPYLRNVHGAAETSLVARILVRGKEDPVEYQYEACPEVLTIKDGEKECQIVFADADTLCSASLSAICSFLFSVRAVISLFSLSTTDW